MANTISVNVVADVKNIRKGIDNVNNQLTGFQKTAGKVGGALKGMFAGAAVLAGGGAVVSIFKDSVGAASDFNETVSKTKTIFGSASGDILKFGANASKTLGMSNNEALQAVSTFGNFFDQIGIGADQSAKLSKEFVVMSSDLASFHNAAPVDVMDALAAATRGEYDALQKYIPTINAAAVQNKAMAMTGKDNVKALTDADKALALNALALEGQGKAAGDFARTSGGLANQQRILSAQWADAKVKLGEVLLPIITKFVSFVNQEGVPAIKQFAAFFKETLWPALQGIGSVLMATVVPAVKTLVGFLANNLGAVVAFGAAFVALNLIMAAHAVAMGITAAGGLVAYLTQTKLVMAATKAWTAVQWLLNTSLFANPIGLVIVAIVALIAIFVLAWKNSEKFREIVIGAWNAIKAATSAVWGFIKDLLSKTWDWIKSAGEKTFEAIKKTITGVWDAIKSATSAVWDAIKAALSAAWDFIKDVVSKGASFVKGIITTYFEAYRAVIEGVWNAVKAVTSTVWDGIKAAVKAVVDWISGAATGVFNGFKSTVSGVWTSIKGATDTAWSGIKTAVSNGVTGVVGFIKGLPGKALSALGNVGSTLYSAGRNLLEGMIRGLKSMATKLANAALAPVKAAVNKVKSFLGINSPSRLFKTIGQQTNEGLAQGLKDVAKVKKAAGNMSNAVTDGFGNPDLHLSTTAFAAGSAGNARGTAVINVTVNAPVGSNPEDIGRELDKYLSAYERFGGRRLS